MATADDEFSLLPAGGTIAVIEPLAPEAAPESFSAQMARQVWRRWSAKLGLAWIAVLAFCAIFAPFLANSHPLLMRGSSGWQSPLLSSLSATDVLLLLLLVAAMALVPIKSLNWARKLRLLAWVGLLLSPALFWPDLIDSWHSGREIQWPWGRAAALGFLSAVAAADLFFIVWLPLRAVGGKRAWGWVLAGCLPLMVVFAIYPVRPPQIVVYERYREAQAAKLIHSVWWAPIPYSPNDNQRDKSAQFMRPPGLGHWMGTEEQGADVMARMIWASRIALSIGFISVGIAVFIGVVVGGIMGFFAGKIDILGMRLIEIFDAVPTLFLLISFVAFFGRNLYVMMAIIGCTSWVGHARFIRAQFLKLRRQDFVQAALAAGLPLRRVLFGHMLPNGISPVLVSATFGVAGAVLAESTLSFLNLGLVDQPSWGQMMNQALGEAGTFRWWVALYPGLAIFLTVFAYNLVGEALRDALDPRLR